MKAVTEFAMPYTGNSSRDLYGWHNHCMIHLSEEGAGKKNEQVTLTSEVQAAFETLKKACHEAPVLTFADFDKPFLMETDASQSGLGVGVITETI